MDSRRIDYQAGQEFGNGAALMALAGVNMIRGPGGCEYGSVVSLEKLLLDNEVCGMALRLTEPMDVNDEQLALDVVRDVAKTRSFIDHPHTLKHFRELYMPSMQLIDRTSRGEFEDAKGPDAYTRAKVRVKEILDDEESYRTVDPDKEERDGQNHAGLHQEVRRRQAPRHRPAGLMRIARRGRLIWSALISLATACFDNP